MGDLKVTSPLRKSNNEASFGAFPNLDGLNLPLGSAKNDLSNNDSPISSLIFLSKIVNSFGLIFPLSNFLRRDFVLDFNNFSL